MTAYNEGWDERYLLTQSSQEVDIIFQPNLPLFNSTGKLVLPADMLFTFTLAKSDFCLHAKSTAPNKYKLVVTKAEFYYRTVQLKTTVMEKIEKELAVTPARYPFLRNSTHSFLLPSGITSIDIPYLSLGVLPIRMFAFLLPNSVLKGNIKKNSLQLDSHGLQSILVTVNEKGWPSSSPLQFKMGSGKQQGQFQRLFFHLMQAIGINFSSDISCALERTSINGGYFVFGSTLTSNNCSEYRIEDQTGQVSVSLEFQKALPEPLTLFTIFQFQGLIEMKINGEIKLNYAA